jgi:Protein of unknown function (DUF3768)
MTDSNAKRIAELNDLCRKAMGIAGRLMQMEGFNTLPLHIQFAMRERVETFDNFTSDNDPYVGVVEHKENRIFWKIEYYALGMMHGSENPAEIFKMNPDTFLIGFPYNCDKPCNTALDTFLEKYAEIFIRCLFSSVFL